jgi:hypothetical protein
MRKTDNHNLNQKVALRRIICTQLAEPLRVLDLFAGEGKLWTEMRKTFTLASYTPVDEKPRQPGAIKMKVDARTVRAFDPKQFNVLDLDSYGEPWEIFAALLPNIQPGTAVFLTYGHVGVRSIRISKFLREQCGIPITWEVPTNAELARFLGRQYLRQATAGRAVRILSAENENVGYYGILFTVSKSA